MSDDNEKFVRAKRIVWSNVSGNLFVDESLLGRSRRTYYRYATLPEVLQLMSSGIISFSDPRVWPDKYERYGMASLFDAGGKFEGSSVFAKCFSGSYSSEALWRIYGADGPVIRYGYALDDLLKQLANATSSSLERIFVAKVQYVSPSEVRRVIARAESAKTDPDIAAQALFYKRKAFDHESELRVVLTGGADVRGSKSMQLVGFDRALVTRVLIDPYIPEWQADVLIDLFKKTLRFDGIVERSSFDRDVPIKRMK